MRIGDENMFFKKKKIDKIEYDEENWKPVMRCSICNGERVAGLKNIHTGEFKDGTLISNDHDLEEFMKKYGIDEITKEY